MAAPVDIQGTCDERFEGVRDAFARNFAEHEEVGASVSAWVDGEKVVDLWGGVANPDSGRAWQQDTIGIIFSATKGLAALAMLMLHDRGQLDHDAPVAEYWPEFGCRGKQAVTVRQLLCHRSGLCALDADLSLDDLENPEVVSRALEQQEPLWTPGQGQGYHGVTYGMYVAELFRRIEGRSLGAFLADQVFEPLRVDAYLGLPESEDHRVFQTIPTRTKDKITRILPAFALRYGVEGRLYRAFASGNTPTARAFGSPSVLGIRGMHNFNLARVRRMELAWANGISNARALARLYACLAAGGTLDGVKVLSKQAIDKVVAHPGFTLDKVLHKPLCWQLGFLKEEAHIFSPYPEAFGHAGAGGHIAFADPPRNLSFGYVMNRMDWRVRSPRAINLCKALYASL